MPMPDEQPETTYADLERAVLDLWLHMEPRDSSLLESETIVLANRLQRAALDTAPPE
jgi:hypothetical protein